MQRIVGGLVAAVATAALWGCDALKELIPTKKSSTVFVGGTSEPTVEITPIKAMPEYSPEPAPVWRTAEPVVPHGARTVQPTTNPTPSSIPSPTPTPIPVYPLWDRYFNGSYPHKEFPEAVQVLQAWEQHGVNFDGGGTFSVAFPIFKHEWDSHNREKPVGMGFDRETGKPVYEFAFLDQAKYPQLQGSGILPMHQLWQKHSYKGPYDAGLTATFMEQDGNLAFHKPGQLRQVNVEGIEYGIYSIAGYRGLDRHLNGVKAEIWDFSKLKSELRLIPPAGMLSGVDITVDSALAGTFIGNDPDLESARIAYDASQGILLIGGGASTFDWIPDAWWGAVRETQTGAKKLHVGYKVPMWFLAEYWRRILSWDIVDGTVYAFTGRGSRSTCDYIAKGTIYRDTYGLDCHPYVMRFPLDMILDLPEKPEWIDKWK